MSHLVPPPQAQHWTLAAKSVSSEPPQSPGLLSYHDEQVSPSLSVVESSFTHSSSRRRVTPGTSARGPLLLKRAAPRAAAALTKPSETSRLPTTGMCQDEDRTEMPRAGTAEAISSAPTRQHLFGAAQLIMAAARLKAGLRSSSCAPRGGSTPANRCATLLEFVGQLTRRRRAARRCFSKKTIEVQRRRRPSPRGTMALHAGLGRLVLAPRRHIVTRIVDGASRVEY